MIILKSLIDPKLKLIGKDKFKIISLNTSPHL